MSEYVRVKVKRSGEVVSTVVRRDRIIAIDAKSCKIVYIDDSGVLRVERLAECEPG